MPAKDRLDYAIDDHRKYNNKNLDIRFTGDGISSDPRTRDNTGRMWVRKQLTDGFAQAVALPLDTNANIPVVTGLAVEVGYVNNEECITRAYRGGFIATGTTPAITNPSDPQVTEENRIFDIVQFFTLRTLDSSKPWAVVVLDGYIEADGVSKTFHQTEVDFDDLALIPSAGQRVIAVIFLKKDMTLETYTSTTIAIPGDPITETMLDECRQQAASDSMAIWGWVLDGDATGLNDDDSLNMDLRPKFTFPASRTATLATTDNTQTTIASIAVAELEAKTITATFTAVKSDYSAALGGTLMAVVRRASGGNVTLVDSVTTVAHEDSSGSPSFTLDVDTGTQTARLRCTGISAEDWLWKCKYEVVTG